MQKEVFPWSRILQTIIFAIYNCIVAVISGPFKPRYPFSENRFELDNVNHLSDSQVVLSTPDVKVGPLPDEQLDALLLLLLGGQVERRLTSERVSRVNVRRQRVVAQ
jgi:hypothetical protein